MNTVEFIYNDQVINMVFDDSNKFLYDLINKEKTFFEISFLEVLKVYIEPYSVIVDVGAHIGNHTIFFSKILKAKKVFAIEPTLKSNMALIKNLELNNITNTLVYLAAISNTRGVAKGIERKSNNAGSNQWVLIDKKDSHNLSHVHSLLLEDIVGTESFDFIKIDVEGSEIEVLEGAKDLIDAYSPLIMIEVDQKNYHNFVKFMNNMRYIKAGWEVKPNKKANTILMRRVL